MPSVSEKQREAMAIAEHDPSKLHAANKGMLNMTHEQLHDFAKGPVSKKPSKVATALGKMPIPAVPVIQPEIDGMGTRPLLKNSKVFNRLKELKGQ